MLAILTNIYIYRDVARSSHVTPRHNILDIMSGPAVAYLLSLSSSYLFHNVTNYWPCPGSLRNYSLLCYSSTGTNYSSLVSVHKPSSITWIWFPLEGPN